MSWKMSDKILGSAWIDERASQAFDKMNHCSCAWNLFDWIMFGRWETAFHIQICVHSVNEIEDHPNSIICYDVKSVRYTLIRTQTYTIYLRLEQRANRMYRKHETNTMKNKIFYSYSMFVIMRCIFLQCEKRKSRTKNNKMMTAFLQSSEL